MTSSTYILVPCTFCRSTTFITLFTTRTNNLEVDYSPSSQFLGNETISRCANCGLVQINPRALERAITKRYVDSHESIHHKEQLSRSETFRRAIRLLKELGARGKLLDVGAASGLLVKVAEEEGFDAYGIEPNIQSVQWAHDQGISKVQSGSFEKMKPSTYEVICFFDVLEHLYDPYKSLQKASKMLSHSGYLLINVPDWNSLSARIFKKRWWFVTSGHLYYFTDAILKDMLQAIGLTIVYSHPHTQTFSLLHLVHQSQRYNVRLARLSERLVTILRLLKIQIHYKAGQRMIIARHQ